MLLILGMIGNRDSPWSVLVTVVTAGYYVVLVIGMVFGGRRR
jgi:hypothetical protein